jgi:hypothetical protein
LTEKREVALKQLGDFEKEHGSTGDNAVEVLDRKSVGILSCQGPELEAHNMNSL